MRPEVTRGREAPSSGWQWRRGTRSWGWAASAWRIGQRARAPEDGGRPGAAGKGDGQRGGLAEGHKDRSTSSPQGPSQSKVQSWGLLGCGGPLAEAELKDEKNQ